MDHVESRAPASGVSGTSPDRARATTYKRAAEDAINQLRAGSRQLMGGLSGIGGGGGNVFRNAGGPGGPQTNGGYGGHGSNP